jgi:poly-gamma-glutamate capsule biosynthesis protein CapA/YwtB (metallophosphatase superfamily)
LTLDIWIRALKYYRKIFIRYGLEMSRIPSRNGSNRVCIRTFRWVIFGSALILSLVACRVDQDHSSVSEMTNSPSGSEGENKSFSSVPVISTPPLEIDNILSPIPSGPTPNSQKQVVKFAVPAQMLGEIRDSLQFFRPEDQVKNLLILVAPNPEKALRSGEVDLAIVPGSDGIVFLSKPKILAVPFHLNWDEVSRARAESISVSGYPGVEVMLWDELDPSHKALRIDGLGPSDPGYPLRKEWSIQSTQLSNELAREIADFLLVELSDEPLHLAAVGDIMLDRGPGDRIRAGDLDFPFSGVGDALQSADLAVANFESVLGSSGEAVDKSYTFQAPASAADVLSSAGIDIVSMANNHAMDFGVSSLLESLDIFQASGIGVIGAGRDETAAHAPLIVQSGRLTIAFLGYVDVPESYTGFQIENWAAGDQQPGISLADPDRIREDVHAAAKIADLVIVSLHSGYEYVPAPNQVQIMAAHAAIEAGADLVLGHHTHVLQPIEFYGEGVIVYGLGNFIFERAGPPESMILNIWLDADGVRELSIVPMVILGDGHPVAADEEQAAEIRKLFYSLAEARSGE